MDKTVRFLRALWKESVKRLPYIIGLLIILGIIGAIQSYRKTAEGVEIARSNTTIIKQQSSDIKTLTKQNKALTIQNNQLAQQNAAHIDCVAKTFATYTQTLRPVHIEDLDKCITSLDASNKLGIQDSSGASGSQQSLSISVPPQPNHSPINKDKQQKSNAHPSVLKQVLGTPNAIIKLLGL